MPPSKNTFIAVIYEDDLLKIYAQNMKNITFKPNDYWRFWDDYFILFIVSSWELHQMLGKITI